VGRVFGTVTHLYMGSGLPEVTIQALVDGTSVAQDITAADGTYEIQLDPGSYTIHPDVAPEDDCFSDLDDVPVSIEAGGEEQVDFSYVPGPCGE
jgi:hypothetical protein